MADEAPALEVSRSSFTSRNEDEAAEYVRRTYVDNQLRFLGRPGADTTDFVASTTTIEDLGADRLRSGFDIDCDADPLDQLMVGHVLTGYYRLQSRTEDVRLRPADTFTYDLGTALHAEVRAPDLALVRIPLERVVELATTHADIGAADFRIHAMTPVSPAMNRFLADMCRLVHRDLASAEPGTAHPLAHEQVVQALAAAVLVVFPNSTTGLHHQRTPGLAAPAVVRRATAFIEAEAHRPITTTEIAAAAGIGPRALQHAFRRHLDTTPLAYLRQVRLTRAHRELQSGDPTSGDTVAAVAARWGFTHPGRFAVAYRRAYGRSPSTTLRG